LSGLYKIGRALQFLSLLVLPLSMWVGWIGHDETASILIFLGSIGAFWLGYGLTRAGTR
jgi:hypothetical protein